MKTKTKTNIEIWLYDNVFNNDKISFRHALWSFYCRSKRRVAIIKSWSIFFKFWKIPTHIANFNNAVDFAKHEIKELREVIEDKDYLIEKLIEQLIIEYTNHLGMSEEEAYREAHQRAYEFDSWIDHIPSKYLTEDEAEGKFDRDLDNHVTYDPIANASYTQMMDYELCQLKKGGIYEANY